jgi:hypothetical protein
MFKKRESTRLGEILVSKGLITVEQLAIATHEQIKRNRLLNVTDAKIPRGVLIGELLVEFGFIDRLELNRGLNWQQHLRHVSIAMALCAPFMIFAPSSASAQTVSSSTSSKSSFTPVTIQAENYASMSGVWNEPTTDVGGGQDTGNINTGDWMSYTNIPVSIPVTGTYKITYRVASLNSVGSLALREASTDATLDTIPIPITGAWQNWVDVTRTVTLTQGTHSFKLFAVAGGFNVNWFRIEYIAPAAAYSLSSKASSNPTSSTHSSSTLSSATNSSSISSPSTITFSSAASANSASSLSNIPQWIIQAENYTSMSGVWNEPTTDIGGGQDTGNINTGDWMSYTNTKVDIPTTGAYKITMRVASLNTAGSLALKEASTDATLDTIPIPVTGAWQNWTDVTRIVTLPQGIHSFKLFAVTGGFNVNWFKIEPLPSQPPLTIQAENYSAMSGVWNEPTTDTGGGQDTGNINSVDWMEYYNIDVTIPTSGSYKMTYRLASLNGGGSFTLNEAGTTTVYDNVSVPKTGNWQSWISVEHLATLPAGKHHFAIKAVAGGFNINWFKIEPISTSTSSTQSSLGTNASSSSSKAALSSSSASSVPSSAANSSSSSTSAVTTSTIVKGPVGLYWMAPDQRENGNFLDITELAGYELRYKLTTANEYTYITLNDAWANQYNFQWLEGTYSFQIAAFDKNGIYSNFVDVYPK